MLALVGAYLVLYWVTALADPFAAPAPVRAVEWAQHHLAAALTASPRLAGAVIGAAVTAALAAAAVHSARAEPHTSALEPLATAKPSATRGDQP